MERPGVGRWLEEEVRMRAFAIHELGQPGSMHELPVPEPGEGEVLVRVAAKDRRREGLAWR
jgi:hypothetical protein